MNPLIDRKSQVRIRLFQLVGPECAVSLPWLISLCAFFWVSTASAFQVPEKKEGIQVAVDTRVELMTIIARLAGAQEYLMANSKSPYAERVEKQFGPFKEHNAVQLFKKNRARYGWSYDAVPSLALHLGPLPELKERMPFEKKPPRLDQRWQNGSTPEYLQALRDFVKVSKAVDFFSGEAKFYQAVEERMRLLVKGTNPVPWFDDFFGIRAGANYQVAPGLLCGGGNYGVGVVFLDGTPEEIRPVLGCWQWDKEGLPVFEENRYLGTFVHELCHSYTNPLCDRHLKFLEPPMAVIYPSVAAKMSKMAYGNPKTVLYESMVRACVIRFLNDRKGQGAAAQEKLRQSVAGFAWVPALADLLDEYARDRKSYPTMEAFVPKIAGYLEEYGKKIKP